MPHEISLVDLMNIPPSLTAKLCGYVALIGRPNSGKSTFINALTEEKVSIISSKPQTTRKMIKGIFNDEKRQIVFFDTPGIHESNELFNISVNSVAYRTLRDADVIVRFVDMSRSFGEEEKHIDEVVSTAGKPVIRVYSKWDSVKGREFPKDGIALSSVSREGFTTLIQAITPHLTKRVPDYDEDFYTDQDSYTRISEIIREKAFELLDEEIPHDLFVSVEETEDQENGTLKILAYLCVERDSQKRIVIGKWAALIQEIGTKARMELEEIFGRKVFLVLRVKSVPHWKKNKKLIQSLLTPNHV